MFGGQLGTSHDQFPLAERPLAGLAFVGDELLWNGQRIVTVRGKAFGLVGQVG